MSHQDSQLSLPESTLLSTPYKKLCPHAKVLYNYLIARSVTRDEWFSYSYKEMRQDSGMRYDMISQSVKELKNEGFVQYRRGGLERNHNIYHLVSQWLIELPSSNIYFAEAVGLGMIKIGRSNNIEARLASIQSTCPARIELRAAIKDVSPKTEQAIHLAFGEDRKCGEWFHLSEKIKAFVAYLQDEP